MWNLEKPNEQTKTKPIYAENRWKVIREKGGRRANWVMGVNCIMADDN